MNREEILNKVSHLTVSELANYILQEMVSLQELKETGDLDFSKREAIQKMLLEKTRKNKEEEEKWEKLKSTEDGCREYLKLYPNGKYVDDANELIRKFGRERKEGEDEKKSLKQDILKHPNKYKPSEVLDFLKEGTITEKQLSDAGIPDEVIYKIHNINPPELYMGVVPDGIPEGFTEVYFWGIPGSGKTTALSAILSTANNEACLELIPSDGYDYMTGLKNIFIDKIGVLPPPSPIDTTQYLPFMLEKEGSKPRSISLIEISGEIFECFYHKNARKPFKSENHQITFDTLINFLGSNNRKIHFFFIDYGRGKKTDEKGYTQADYLDAAATYFGNNTVFDKKTDAVYIVVTKSDLMGMPREERRRNIKDYLKENNFNNFVQTLKRNCKKYSINGGEITALSFSLGRVYFKEICDFEDGDSKVILDILYKRIKPQRRTLRKFFNS